MTAALPRSTARGRLRSSGIPAWARLAIIPGLLLASGCSWLMDDEGWIQDRRDEYREAESSRVPVIPEDLDGSAIQEAMFVPEVDGMEQYRARDEFELPRPATLFAREEEEVGVRIQRFGGDSWIVAPDSPSQVWPRVKQFLSDNGVAIDAEVPEDGIIESDWIRVEDAEYRDLVRTIIRDGGGAGSWQRLRLRIEQAVRRGATEIHLAQFASTSGSDSPDWSDGSSNAELESELLAELAGYLAADVGTGGVSFVAQAIASRPKAEVVRTSEQPPALRLRLDFPRAWATVDSALDNAEMTVEEADREARSYRIRYNEAQFRDEEPGWFARLFDFGSDDPAATGDPYVLSLTPVDGGFDVLVLDESGMAVDRETSEQILTLLREFAS